METQNFPSWFKVDALYNSREVGVPYSCSLGNITYDKKDLYIRIKIAKKQKKNIAIFYFNPQEKKPIFIRQKSCTKRWSTYVKNIPIYEQPREIFDTLPGQNYVMVSLMNPERNSIEIWQVSVVSQRGNFFLRTQKITSQVIYKNNLKHLIIRDLSYWKDLERFIESLYLFKNMPVSLKIPIERGLISSNTILSNNEGVILWWNEASRCGMVITNHGIAYVDWYEVIPLIDYVSFTAGEHVSFGSKHKSSADWMFQACPLHLKNVRRIANTPDIPVKPYFPGQKSAKLRNISE